MTVSFVSLISLSVGFCVPVRSQTHQKDSRKLCKTCISRMYVNEFEDGHVEVKYISAHTGHELNSSEIKYLSLPESTKQAVATKLCLGIPSERILEGLFIIAVNAVLM